ncbi:MAG: DUF192 domain-containing protein [Gemmatimonadota bacterium]
MLLRELFHKGKVPGFLLFSGLSVALVGLSACAQAGAETADVSSAANVTSSATPSREVSTSPEAFPPAGYAWVIMGADTVLAEVAATPDERAEGLMYREAVPDGTGMLFVFQDNQPRAFWMANTYVALDIAYMDPSYRIVDIIAMEPLVEESYPSDAPAMFALEVRQGWFEEQGITVGTRADIVFGVQGR